MSIKVIIADDQILMREGLGELLGATGKIDVIGLAADGEEAFKIINEFKPDVAIVDVRMPKVSGIDLLNKLNKFKIKCPVLLLTTFWDKNAMLEGLTYGAKGYLLKDTKPEKLCEAVKLLSCGKSYIMPSITNRIFNELEHFPKHVETFVYTEKLTLRETEIIRLIGSGLNNKLIGRALGCSEGTVRNHMSNILSKLGVKDRTQALLKAIDLGFI